MGTIPTLMETLIPMGQLVDIHIPEKEKAMPTRINTPQDKILDALFSLYMATSEQLTRLLFSRGSATYVRANLSQLVKRGFATVLNEHTSAIQDPMVFGVGPNGWQYLKALGKPIELRYRDIKGQLPLGYPLRHTLAVNDLLISAMLLSHEAPHVYLRDFFHEIEFKRKPIMVTHPKPYTLKPDLMLDFAFHNSLTDTPFSARLT
jgi:hypothetical protein